MWEGKRKLCWVLLLLEKSFSISLLTSHFQLSLPTKRCTKLRSSFPKQNLHNLLLLFLSQRIIRLRPSLTYFNVDIWSLSLPLSVCLSDCLSVCLSVLSLAIEPHHSPRACLGAPGLRLLLVRDGLVKVRVGEGPHAPLLLAHSLLSVPTLEEDLLRV